MVKPVITIAMCVGECGHALLLFSLRPPLFRRKHGRRERGGGGGGGSAEWCSSLSLSLSLSSVEANGESTEKEGGGREGLFYISLRGGGKAVCAKKLEWKRGKTPFLFQSPFLSVVFSAVCFW